MTAQLPRILRGHVADDHDERIIAIGKIGRLNCLYSLIEWGGLTARQWDTLHELEYELGITEKLETGAETGIKGNE